MANLSNATLYHKLNAVRDDTTNDSANDNVDSNDQTYEDEDYENNNSIINVSDNNYKDVQRKQEHVVDEIEKMMQKWSLYRNDSSTHLVNARWYRQWRRRERHHYFPLTSTAHFT